LLALGGKAADAIRVITSSLTANRPTGTLDHPFFLSSLALAHAEVGQFDDAWRCIGEAVMLMEKTKERWYEAEVNRTAGEIALLSPELFSPEQDRAKSEAYFERALAIARQQQALDLKEAKTLPDELHG
jgi:predicted ATPase